MPIKKVDVSSPRMGYRAFLIYGGYGSGKTRFAATFPRPLFLSDGSEKGWETIQWMKPDDFYEAGRRPDVWRIDRPEDMIEAVNELESILKKDEARYRTVVIDQLTHYADMYYATLEQIAFGSAKGKRPDGRQMYGDLASHLRYLMLKLHALPINTVWVCLVQEPDSERGIPGGPLISGRTKLIAPAKCNYVWYCRVFNGPDNKISYEVRTETFGPFWARGRDGHTLPDPMPPNYRAFENTLEKRVEKVNG